MNTRQRMIAIEAEHVDEESRRRKKDQYLKAEDDSDETNE